MTELAKKKAGKLTAREQSELGALADRVRVRLERSAEDILAVGADLTRAKELLGHGGFGAWLDSEFSLSRRSAEQFMAASRRFGARNEVVAHLPAGAVLELSAPSVPDELVERVISGEVPPSVSAIRQERAHHNSDGRSAAVGGTFIDYLERLRPNAGDFAAGVAAQVLRRWKDPDHRAWFARCMRSAAELLEGNLERKVPLLELPRTTVRRLKGEGE